MRELRKQGQGLLRSLAPLTIESTTTWSSLWKLEPDLLKALMAVACGAGGNWLGRKTKGSLGNNAHYNVIHNTCHLANASSDSSSPFMGNPAHSPLQQRRIFLLRAQAHTHTQPCFIQAFASSDFLLSTSDLGWKNIEDQKLVFPEHERTWCLWSTYWLAFKHKYVPQHNSLPLWARLQASLGIEWAVPEFLSHYPEKSHPKSVLFPV